MGPDCTALPAGFSGINYAISVLCIMESSAAGFGSGGVPFYQQKIRGYAVQEPAPTATGFDLLDGPFDPPGAEDYYSSPGASCRQWRQGGAAMSPFSDGPTVGANSHPFDTSFDSIAPAQLSATLICPIVGRDISQGTHWDTLQVWTHDTEAGGIATVCQPFYSALAINAEDYYPPAGSPQRGPLAAAQTTMPEPAAGVYGFEWGAESDAAGNGTAVALNLVCSQRGVSAAGLVNSISGFRLATSPTSP